jgi:predicted N-acetyltransferase YhbS
MQKNWASRKKLDTTIVLGNRQYYERFGFQKASHFYTENEASVDDEFMIIRFSANQFLQDHVPRRLVRYAPEFALFCL